MAYKLTDKEKDAHVMMKKLVKKPTKLKASDFTPGNMVFFTYRAKYDQNPYDMSPLILVLRRSKKYTLGLNINWVPPKLRERLMDFILKGNKKNVEQNKPLSLSYDMIKNYIMRMGAPAIRLYLNNRISPKGVVIPHYYYYKVVSLRSENFIGISADKAWALAIQKARKRKKKKS